MNWMHTREKRINMWMKISRKFKNYMLMKNKRKRTKEK